MTAEEQLIQQLRDLLRSGRPERTPLVEDVAEQYADICMAANERLNKCATFLDKGMRSEAVHEVGASPALLDLIDAINFQEVTRWREFCEECQLPPPPPLHLEIVERLRAACTKEQELAPLMRTYRRLVYQGDTQGCIELLRQIRERDPDNGVWAENLRPLEEKALPELIRKARKALDAHNLNELREVNKDLAHAQRSVPPPADLMEDIRRALHAKHSAEVHAGARRLNASLREASAVGDFALCESLLAEWKRLEQDELFKPSETDRRMVQEVEAKVAEEQERADKGRAFQDALTELRYLVNDSHTSPEALALQLDTVRAFNTPVPDDVANAVEQHKERVRRAKRQRRRLYAMAVAAVIVLLFVGIVAMGRNIGASRQRSQTIASLSALLQQERFAELHEQLERLSTRDRALYNSPELVDIRAQTDTALATRREQEARYRAVASQLAQIRSNAFTAPDAQIAKLLAEAEELAAGPDAEQELKSFQIAWELSRARQTQSISERLQQLTAVMQNALLERDTQSFSTLEAEAKILEQLQAQRREAAAVVTGAAPTLVEEFKAVAARLDAWQQDYVARRAARDAAREKLGQLRRQLRLTLPNMREYGRLLEEFAGTFPEETDAPEFRAVLGRMDRYIQAAALHSFSLDRIPPDAEVLSKIQELLNSPEGLSGSVWEPDLLACTALATTMEELRNSLMAMAVSRDDMLNLQVLHYRPKDSPQWRNLYHLKPIRSREEEEPGGQRYTVYWGEVYHYDAVDKKPLLEHTSRIFPNRLTTLEYEVKSAQVGQDNRVPHAQFLVQLLAETTTAAEPDIMVLRKVQALLDVQAIALVPKCWMLKQCVHALVEALPRVPPELLDMQRLLKPLNTEAPWMNPEHPETVAAVAEMRAALEKFPSPETIIRRLTLDRALLRSALSRHVRCIGSLQRDERGRLSPALVTSPPAVAWVLTMADATARPMFKVVAQRAPDGHLRVREELLPRLAAGEVLFAPGDGLTTERILRNLGVTDRPGANKVTWPHSWPRHDP